MKIVITLLFTLMLSSCLGPEKGVEEEKITGSAPGSDFHSGGGGSNGGASEESASLKSDITFKNYSQYNMNLSKATGISRAKVNDVYLKVKNSLIKIGKLRYSYFSFFIKFTHCFIVSNILKSYVKVKSLWFFNASKIALPVPNGTLLDVLGEGKTVVFVISPKFSPLISLLIK